MVAKKPENPAFATNEPPVSITTATPNAAPVSIPRIEGPAKGLLKVVCNNNPATARLQPANKAVMA